MKDKVERFLKSKNCFSICVVMMLGVSLIPLLWISKYNVMAADDFSMGKRIHLLWENGGDFWELLQCAIQRTAEMWHNFQGRFVAGFINCFLDPGIYGEQFAWITPVIMVIAVMFFVYWVVRTMLNKYYNATKGDLVIVWGILCFLIMQTCPSPVEFFYWFQGASQYTFLHFFMLGFFCLLESLEREVYMGKKILLVVLTSLYAFIVGGSHEVTILQCLLGYMVFLLFHYKSIKWWKMLPGIAFVVSFFINVLAPGNMVRRGLGNGMSPVTAIIQSFVYALSYIKDWISPLLAVSVLFLVPIVWKILKRKKQNINYRFPGLITLGSYCMFAATFTPSLYGMGNVAAGRLLNVIQVTFYLILFCNLFYWLGWFEQKMNQAEKGFFKDLYEVMEIIKKYDWAYKGIMLMLICLVIVGTGDKNTFSSVSAVRSLVLGEAQTYYAEAQERLVIYKDDTIQIAEVKPFSVKPYVLYFTDIGSEGDENYWINEHIADYYQKEKVILLDN